MKRRRRKSRIRRKGLQRESLHHIPPAVDLQRAIKSGHYTPETVLALQQVAGNQAAIQRAPGGSVPPSPTKAQTAAEKRLKEIIASLKADKKNDGKTDSEQYQKALIAALKGFIATDLGKKIKARALKKALSADGLPLTILLGSGVIAGMFAANVGIPGIPDIELSDDLSLSLEIEGSMQNPTGIKFAFKYRFGGAAKPEKKSQSADPRKLSPEMLKAIQDLDKRLIADWIVARAEWEYVIAGPDEEDAKQKRHEELKANAAGLPDVHMVSEALVQLLIDKAGDRRIEFDLKHGNNEVWNQFYELKGLEKVFELIVTTIVPLLPTTAQTIEEIVFKCGKQDPIKIEVEKEEAKED